VYLSILSKGSTEGGLIIGEISGNLPAFRALVENSIVLITCKTGGDPTRTDFIKGPKAKGIPSLVHLTPRDVTLLPDK